MSSKLRSVLLALTLVTAASIVMPAVSSAQLNDPPPVGGTQSRYVGGTMPASPWISLGYVLRAQAPSGFGFAFAGLSVGRPAQTIVRRGAHPERQLSW